MRTNVLQVLKAVFAAVLFSLVFVLIFTVIIQLFSLPLEVVKPVNQVFKIISIAAGGLIFIRGEKGLFKRRYSRSSVRCSNVFDIQLDFNVVFVKLAFYRRTFRRCRRGRDFGRNRRQYQKNSAPGFAQDAVRVY